MTKWTWSVSYETATLTRGTAGTKAEAELAAARAEAAAIGRGLNPDALAYHVREGR